MSALEELPHPLAVRDFAVAPRRGKVLLPGLPEIRLGVERIPIEGGGSRVVEVEAGDKILIIDKDGCQPCALAVFASADGKSDLQVLGESALPKGPSIATLLQSSPSSSPSSSSASSSSAKVVREKMRARKCALRERTSLVFSEGSHAGQQRSFLVHEPALLFLCAVDQDALCHESPSPARQNPASEILLYIERSGSRRNFLPDKLVLPSPLAEPLEDFTIMPGEAKAYIVKKGQFIQILDVRGRECSDFQAFSLRGLDAGKFCDIDPTTTRSLNNAIYPGPGLYSKYFSIEQKPLIEIVQDTVGRHDSFALACTARNYEDAGYPGHVNCSDNLSAQAAPYGIPSRAGWPAINFFFNTALENQHCIVCDEPWSRPGDYVLLRALEDLLCFSTACPSDIDPSNAWNPTEIQVRVYAKKAPFSQGSGLRITTDGDCSMTKETAFHSKFAQHTKNFIEYNGYWLAQDFPKIGMLDEYWACREKVVVMDLSPLRKYEVLGPDARDLLQWCATRDVRRLSQGQVVYTAMCYENGGMIDDGTIFHMGENAFRWIGGCDSSGVWMKEQAEKRNLDVRVKSATDQLHNIAVQGPKSREALRGLFWTAPTQPSFEDLSWFRFTVARIGDRNGIPVIVSRTGYTGELGYEIFCHPKDAEAVFDAIWNAGQQHGLVPFGLGALDMVRIEAGLIFAGYEFSDRTDPFEAGIGFTVPLKSKTDDFCGKEALQRRKSSPRQKLVGLRLEGNVVPSSGDGIRNGRAQIGEITSAVHSPILKETIALARVDIEYALEGQSVEVGQLDGHQKRIVASVVPFPFYDPKKERVRA